MPDDIAIHHYRSCREHWRNLTMGNIPRPMGMSMFDTPITNDVLLCDNFKRVQSSTVLNLGNAIRESVRRANYFIGI